MVIHCENCMLVYDANTGSFRQEEFSPKFFSRNQIPYKYSVNAECPKFLNDFLRRALREDDIMTLQYILGQFLLGRNMGQTFMLLTGAAGAGKSTLINRLISVFRLNNRRIGARLFDPESPLTGGSIMADRVRMQKHATDKNVFIRSFTNKKNLAVSPLVLDRSCRAMSAAGFNTILIESVGTGQSELTIRSLVDIVLVVLPSDFGDKLQVIKSGILEIADILIVRFK